MNDRHTFMTGKFKQITSELRDLGSLKAVKSMSDDDFIAKIEAINLLCNTYDDLGIDNAEIRKRIKALYIELSRRIWLKDDSQLAMPLIKALNELIYGRENDCVPKRWRDTLSDVCRKVVDSYRKNPIIDQTEYLFALDVVCTLNDDDGNPDFREYKETIARYLEGIEKVSLAERIRRVRAYERARLTFTPDNWEEWTVARESLKGEDLSELDDDTLILWWEITDEPPMKELKKRAGNSSQMAVEYLQAQVFTEFARQTRLKAKRKLSRGLKKLNDDIIGDIIHIKITADMSVATLYALETIFYLRLQLAQVGWEENESIYEALCQDRFRQIAKALIRKYKTTESLNEKIEILERLSSIGQLIHSDDFNFAIEEADKLLSSLLPTTTTPTTPTTTPLQGGLGGLPGLLTLATYWNSDTSLRQKIESLTSLLLHTLTPSPPKII